MAFMFEKLQVYQKAVDFCHSDKGLPRAAAVP